MSVVYFPVMPAVAAAIPAHKAGVADIHQQAVRQFALTIAARLRDDAELNRTAPLLVDKVILLLIKESRGAE